MRFLANENSRGVSIPAQDLGQRPADIAGKAVGQPLPEAGRQSPYNAHAVLVLEAEYRVVHRG